MSWRTRRDRIAVAFRLALLGKHPRHIGALKLAAEKAGWDAPFPKGDRERAQGAALAGLPVPYKLQVAGNS